MYNISNYCWLYICIIHCRAEAETCPYVTLQINKLKFLYNPSSADRRCFIITVNSGVYEKKKNDEGLLIYRTVILCKLQKAGASNNNFKIMKSAPCAGICLKKLVR
jgi:hypothetical protein